MAKNRFSEIYDPLPAWGKFLVIAAAVTIPTVVGISIYNGIKRRQAAKTSVPNVAQHDLELLAQGGIVPSYMHSQYLGWADSIAKALDYCGTGDFQTTIINIFDQMRNAADVVALINAFADREQNPCWYSHPFNTFSSYFKVPHGDLTWWLKSGGLTQDDIDTINKNLSDKGINYTIQ